MLDDIENAYPLTPMQQGLLYEVLRQPDTDVYVAYIVFDIKGPLDEQTLKRAWETAVDDHETLRTRFLWEDLDEPLQVVNSRSSQDGSSLHWVRRDISSVDDVPRFVAMERTTPMSISDAPATRHSLLCIDEEHHVFVWTVHHLLADDWSTPLMLQSVAEHYERLSNATFDSVSTRNTLEFAHYVHWLESEDWSASEDYWRKILTGCHPQPLALLTGHRTESQHVRHVRSLNATASASMTNACRRYSVTLSSFMHAAWALVVARYAKTNNPVFGTSVSGRTCPLPHVEQSVGLFLNTLPTSIQIDLSYSVADYLKAVQSQLFSQMEHEHYPLSSMGELVGQAPGESFFDSVLVIESHGPELIVETSDQALTFSNIRYETDSNYPLTLLVFPGNTLAMHFLCPAGQFVDGVIEQLADELAQVMADLSGTSQHSLSGLISAQSLRFESYIPRLAFNQGISHRRVDRWIDELVANLPNAVAVIDEHKSYCYHELQQASERCAHALVQPDTAMSGTEFVGIYLHRSFHQIAAMLGVLASGKAYVPLDPLWPESRRDNIIRDAGITVVVTDSVTAATLDGLDATLVLMDNLPAKPAKKVVADGGDAYMIYTSGSSGQPKGVVVSHANLMYSTAARLDYYQTSPSRFLLLSSYAFDSSVAGIYWTLCTGGTLVLPGAERDRDIHELSSLIKRHRVTHTLCLPSLYALLLEYSNADDLCSLENIIVAGEACSKSVVELHHAVLPNARLYNEYGPTEATVWSSAAQLNCSDAGTSQVSIGTSIPGSVLKIVDNDGQICPTGVVGEILIEGPGVVSGYWRDKDLTVRQFPKAGAYLTGDAGAFGSNGELYFLGRLDRQIKIRGHRIEPIEIETRVEQHDFVANAVCSLTAAKANDELVCFYSLSPEALATAEMHADKGASPNDACYELSTSGSGSLVTQINTWCMKKLRAELPQQFGVTKFVALNRMPRLPNGKTDIAGLHNLLALQSDLLSGLSSVAEPDNAMQGNALNALLAQLLGLSTVNNEDSFFSLGGDSLTAIRFVAAAREQGMNLSVPMLTQHSTMGAIWLALQTASEKIQAHSVETIAPNGIAPLSPIQRWFFSCGHENPAHWNMASIIHLTTAVPLEQLHNVIVNEVSRHPVLGTRFILGADETIQQLPLTGPTPSIKRMAFETQGESALVSALLKQQKDFDLEKGILISFVLVENQEAVCDTFGMVAHHLVTDAVSNLLLASAIAAASDGSHLAAKSLPPNTTSSYREWSMRFDNKAKALVVQPPADLHQSPVLDETVTAKWQQRDSLEQHLVVDAKLLAKLKQGCQLHQVALHECVLYALMRLNPSPVLIDVETHGRDVMVPDMDASLMLGWFSSFFPLMFEPSDVSNQVEQLIIFRDDFRQARESAKFEFLFNPTGYFNDACAAGSNRQTRRENHRVLFNYLAVASDAQGHVNFKQCPLLDPGFREPTSVRSHAIEFVVTDDPDAAGGLRVIRHIDSNLAYDAQHAQWSANALECLQGLATMLVEADRVYTHTDFPDSGMEGDELDRFLSGFD